jgi:hypothetical protein
VVTELAAAPPRRGRRRTRRVEPSEPDEVPVTRLTVTGQSLADDDEGSAWLAAVTKDRERSAEEIRAAVRVVNRALSALRAEAGDPLVQDVGATKALAIRLGYGTGDQLAEGHWSEASQLPPPRRGRLDDVDPQSRVAAVLAGRDEVHPAETLIMRARLDAQQGRRTEAIYGVRAARAALEDQPSDRAKQIWKRIEELDQRLRADAPRHTEEP